MNKSRNLQYNSCASQGFKNWGLGLLHALGDKVLGCSVPYCSHVKSTSYSIAIERKHWQTKFVSSHQRIVCWAFKIEGGGFGRWGYRWISSELQHETPTSLPRTINYHSETWNHKGASELRLFQRGEALEKHPLNIPWILATNVCNLNLSVFDNQY